MAGHGSRVARTPVSGGVMMVLVTAGWALGRRSYRHVAVLSPRPVRALLACLLEAAHYHLPSLGRVDDVVDHCPPRRHVRVDLSANRLEHLRASLLRRSEEHTSELQSQSNLVCRLLLEKKK